VRLVHFLLESDEAKRWREYVKTEPMIGAAADLVGRIEKAGHRAYIVGGAVRDIVLGSKPKDVDVATNCPMGELEELFGKVYDVGKSKDFGIVVVRHKGFDFEVAQFRTDGRYLDGRRPESVKICSDFRSDASRRDFCINALAVDKDGNIIDHFDGRGDIKNQLVRTVGNPHDRFDEDKLRMLRAVRFANRLGFEIDPKTSRAIRIQAKDITKIAMERVRDELVKMAAQSGDRFADAVLMLDEVGILEIILPEVVKMKEFLETPAHHPEAYAFGDGTVFDHTLQALRQNRLADPLVNLAVLLHDVGKPGTYKNVGGKHTYHGHAAAAKDIIDGIAKRLKLTNRERDAIMFAAVNHMKIFRSLEMKPSKILKIVDDENWAVLKAVAACDDSCRIGLFDRKQFEEIIARMEEIGRKWGSKAADGAAKVVDGRRVMQLTGLRPGKRVGEIISKVTQYVVDNGLKRYDVDELILRFAK
jgi:tRNA nucleotidyltransferase/poly(A) polymerase